jgi:DNA repair exonuclease SbcCD nuclease subunit
MGKGRVWLITDTHLGVRNNAQEWIEIHSDFFKKWFIPLLEREVRPGDVLLHGGDVFDSRQAINLKVLNLGIEIFTDLARIFPAGVHVICGNHDIYGKDSNSINSLKPLGLIPGIKIYDEPSSLVLGGTRWLMMPWRKDEESAKKAIEEFGAHDYMLCHSDFKGLLFNRFTRVEHGITEEDLAPYQKVYSGHIHYRQQKGKINMLGSPYQMTRSDIGNPKGVTLLDLETGEERFFENSFSPRFLKINFSEILEATPQEINPKILNNFVDIIVQSSIMGKIDLNRFNALITGHRSIAFVPSAQMEGSDPREEGEVVVPEFTGGSFMFMELLSHYLENSAYDEDSKKKIYQSIEKIYNRVLMPVEDEN